MSELRWVFLFYFLLIPSLYSAESKTHYSFRHSLSAKLSYIDKFQKMNGKSSDSTQLQNIDNSRTLGLTKFEWSASLSEQSKGGVEFNIRPDYTLYSTSKDNTVEYESKATDPYQSSPRLELLDTYQFLIHPLEQMKIRIGVFNDVAQSTSAYDDLIQFTGKVEFPRKTFGLQIRWSDQTLRPTAERPQVSPSFEAGVIALNGNDDRSYVDQTTDDKFDRGPAVKDPYFFQSAYVKLFILEYLYLSQQVGFETRKIETAQIRGKSASMFFQTALHLARKFSNTLWLIGVDYRSQLETFSLDQYDFRQHEQNSIEATTSFTLKNGFSLLGGYRKGYSDRLKSDMSGSQKRNYDQIETGIRYAIEEYFLVTLLAADSSFTLKDDQNGKIGFLDKNNADKKNLRRIMFQLSYYFSSDI